MNLRRGALAAGHSYNTNIRVSIPDAIAGNFSLIVITDVFNNIYEHTNEEDNILASTVKLGIVHAWSELVYSHTIFIQPPINVILAPPPDLIVTSLQVEDMYSSGDSIITTYTVENIGAGEPFERFWRDRLVCQRVYHYIVFLTIHSGCLSPCRC